MATVGTGMERNIHEALLAKLIKLFTQYRTPTRSDSSQPVIIKMS